MKKNKALERIGYWSQLLLLPVYWFSFCVPRSKKIWLFGSTFGRRFADNPRYLFLYVSQHKEELGLRPIWISHERGIVEFLQKNGYEAYEYHSLKGIWYALRGKVYFFDNYSKDINFWQSGGAIKVNLWHGVGNKRINYDNEFDTVRHPKNKWEAWKSFPRRLSDEKPSHYVLATSQMMADIFAGAFRVPRSHVLVAGYPRNDVFIENNGFDMKNLLMTDNEKQCLQRIRQWKEQGKKINLYMPTFRASEEQFMKCMDLEKWNEFLTEEGMIFLVKLHPKSKLQAEFKTIETENIVLLEADMDVYGMLVYTDMLTTDYSSIYSDYMLLEKPVVAFQYDYDTYSKETRGEYFDFDEYMPEEKARTMEELLQATRTVLKNDIHKQERRKSCRKMYDTFEIGACFEIVRMVKTII